VHITIGWVTDGEDRRDPFHDDFELQAERDLARELNKGNVVAFVGSGVTVAYGRPAWSALVDTIVGTALGAASSVPAEQAARLDPLVRTLEHCRRWIAEAKEKKEGVER
jgi:hypothetical protein